MTDEHQETIYSVEEGPRAFTEKRPEFHGR